MLVHKRGLGRANVHHHLKKQYILLLFTPYQTENVKCQLVADLSLFLAANFVSAVLGLPLQLAGSLDLLLHTGLEVGQVFEK